MQKSVAALVVVLLVSAVTVSGAAPPDTFSEAGERGIGSGIRTIRDNVGDEVAGDEASDEDGLRATTRVVPLEPETSGTVLRNEHGDVAIASKTIDLPERPEMVILEEVQTGSELAVRSRNGGVWSEWIDLVATEDEAPDGAPGGEGEVPNGITGIGPIWLGEDAEQLEIVGFSGDTDVVVESLEVLDTPSAAIGPRSIRSSAAAAAATFIRPRSHWQTSGMGWASYNSDCGSGPKTSTVTGMVVHHTAGANGYSAEAVPGILRGIWYYHVQSRGWCDVAYNFFVDRFGQVWEGRHGGIDKAIIGGHTFGFNTYTSGVAQLGNFDTTGSPSAMTRATGALVGWKLSLHGVDPSGKTTYVNSASTTASDGTPPGGKKTLSSVVGHRDLGSTSCPGANTYAQLGRIRADAKTGAHLRALFRAFIGRSPSANEFGHWNWIAQTSGLATAADRLSESAEYAGVVIDELYRAVLGRSPDANGRNYWLGKIRAGMTVSEVSTYFFGSPEYYEKTGGRGGFVDALYLALLHRASDPNGRAYWVGQIDRGATPAMIASSFIDSIESRRDRVIRLYRRFLGRNPDSGGLAYWADVLAGSDDLKLATYLALSDEFYRRSY